MVHPARPPAGSYKLRTFSLQIGHYRDRKFCTIDYHTYVPLPLQTRLTRSLLCEASSTSRHFSLPSFSKPFTMLRQAIATSSRALRSAPRTSSAAAPLVRPSHIYTRAASSPAFTIRAAGSRWYSDAKTSTSTGEQAEAPASDQAESKESSAQSDAVAELKKALEAKEAEVKDWKVRSI